MLNNGTVSANLRAADLGRARNFYADKLGLTPSQEFGGLMLVYRTAGGSTFSIYQTEYAGQAGHTQAQWHVDATVRDLKSKDVCVRALRRQAGCGVEQRRRPRGRHGEGRVVQGQ